MHLNPTPAAKRPQRRAGVLLAAAASAAAGLPIAWPGALAPWVAWLLVSGLGSLLAWKLHTASREAAAAAAGAPAAAATADAPQAGGEPLRQLVAGVLPVWQRHLRNVQGQTEDAVAELVGSFRSIKNQFVAAGFVGVSAENEHQQTSFSLLTLCERELRPVVSTMGQILDSKATLVDAIGQLVKSTDELKALAQDVSRIAAHTNILAINAAIEAAHAGDLGRGFAVIAKEIRELSHTSAATGNRIAERMGQIEAAMAATAQAAVSASAHDREAIELAGSVVQDVLSHVRELGRHFDELREKGVSIRHDTERLLVNLQFQDRTSQMMQAIDRDVTRLQDMAQAPAGPVPSAEAWLAELDTRYTMDEQRRAGAAGSGGTQAAPEASAEIEFF